jgi:anaerobic magnesium-protoporphyrin IX monomethyl ester cyclase
MRVLFVYPNITGHESVHQGLMSLSACLKKSGHTVSLIDFSFGASKSNILFKAARFQPDLVAITATSGMFNAAIDFSKRLKKTLAVPVVFGGVHPTVCPDEAIRNDALDIVCLSEGEGALLELVERMEAKEDYSGIKNLWVKKNGRIHRNLLRPLITDLDSLPFPDFDLFDMDSYLDVRNGSIDIITGRGCPFKCTYCVNPKLRGLHNQDRRYARKHSVEYVIGLIKHVRKKYSINFISFEDDLFTMSKHWLASFCSQYGALFGNIGFSCNARVETVDAESMRILKDAGCKNIHMGIEAGDEHIRKKILNRHMSDEQIMRRFKEAKEAGLSITSYNILGSPFETEATMMKTIEINEAIQPDHIGVSIFCPYPGTTLYDLCIKEGFISSKTQIPSQHRTKPVLMYKNHLERKGERSATEFTEKQTPRRH